MALRLKPHEDLSTDEVVEGLRRAMRGELERALRVVGAASQSRSTRKRDEAVHATRKSLKRLRAALRLLRDALGDRRYRRENLALRDAGRPLTDVRDAKVFLDALATLRNTAGAPPQAAALDALERRLEAHRRAITHRVLGEGAGFEGAAAALSAALDRLERWSLDEVDGRALIQAALARAYRRGRRALQAAREHRSSDRLHEWRKQSKYFLYQLQILEARWSAGERELARQLDRLCDLLGDDHDLAELRARVEEPEVLRWLEARRGALEREAFALGRVIYASRPRAALRKIHGAWSGAHGEAAAAGP